MPLVLKPRTVARIDLEAVRENFRVLRSLAEEREIVAVVKADAYGHGAVEVARALGEAGCGTLAVFTVQEAEELRAAGIQLDLLLLGGVLDQSEATNAIELSVIPVVHRDQELSLIADAAKLAGASAAVQVEVDTGMRRMGVRKEDALALIRSIADHSHLRLSGVFTHLARADEKDLGPTRKQLTSFSTLLDALRDVGIDPGMVHAENSAALLVRKELGTLLSAMTAVRPGLALYGIRPADHIEAPLRPAMNVTARVASVRSVREGETIGYGGTHTFLESGWAATISIGYADGVRWSMANQGVVLIRGHRLPVVGRVSMDSITVSLGQEPIVQVGDEALIFGVAEEGVLPVEEVAKAARTIPYELVTCIGRRIERAHLELKR